MRSIFSIFFLLFVNTLAFAQEPYTLQDEDVIVEYGILKEYTNTATNIIIPEKLDGQLITTIGETVFSGDHLTSVVFPHSLTTIENFAFENNQLTNLELPNSVVTIGAFSFRNNQLTSLNLPNSVTTIGAGAFNNNKIQKINDQQSDGIIYIRKKNGSEYKSFIISYGGIQNNINFIPNFVTIIGNYAFQDTKLTNLEVPSSVEMIGIKAFYWNQLTSIVFKEKSSIEAIKSSAFYGFKGKIKLPTHANPNFIEYKDSNGKTYQPGDFISDFYISYEAVFKK